MMLKPLTRLRITREERIQILRKRIENFKRTISDPNTFDHSIYSSNSPKKDRIRAWGEALEQLHELGEYKDDIDTISTHIGAELKALGLTKAVAWSREVLPLKYKDSAKIHAEQLLKYEYEEYRKVQPRETLKSKEQITLENQPYIDLLNRNIDFLQDFTKELETTEFLRFIPPLEFNEYKTRSEGLENLIRQTWDARNKVLPEKLHLLIQGSIEGTKSNAFTWYLKFVDKIKEITPKQTGRLLSGRISKVELLYEPKNRQDARQAGFYGKDCDECGSWRVDVRYNSEPPDIDETGGRNMLFCYACKNWNEIKTEKLMNKVI